MKLRILALILLAAVMAPLLALAGGPDPIINGASTTWSPIPVGTSTPVVVLYGRPRCSWTMTWSGSGNLWCAEIPATVAPVANWTSTTGGSTTPSFTPASGIGFPFFATQAPWSSGGSIVSDPSIGYSCVSDSGTLAVSTIEFPHCYGQKLGQP
jgi:hypothetical protein